MPNIARDLTDLIGNTPLLDCKHYAKDKAFLGTVLAKLEYFNPLGSAKDRAALYMLNFAEKSGLIKQGTTIIEPTSGNTGIGLAYIGAIRGYKVILVMPETMSIERRTLLKALGAEVVLTPGEDGISGSIRMAQTMLLEIPNSYMPKQFDNPANPEAHRQTTAAEIWRDTDGKVDVFVATVGTGGTLTGTGEALKEKNPAIHIVAVEPEGSPVLSGGCAGAHKIQGIGAGFVPSIYNANLVDEVIKVSDSAAYETARALAKAEGLLVGISSGAAFWAAAELAKRSEYEGKIIVALLPDGGERYLSGDLFKI